MGGASVDVRGERDGGVNELGGVFLRLNVTNFLSGLPTLGLDDAHG